MAEPKPFSAVKLICGIIASDTQVFSRGEKALVQIFGQSDAISPLFAFDFTDYYEKQMGKNLRRQFLSFLRLIRPERISEIKLQTNRLEKELKAEFQSDHRIINLDPGYITPSALIITTTKDFSHRVPLQKGIYAHLELLFGKNNVRPLSWTYPDFKSERYHVFFLKARKIYLEQIKRNSPS